MSNFEEARHQGFSQADLAQEMRELEERIDQLGCHMCKYAERSIKTCDNIIQDIDGIYPKCPYFKKEEE